MSLLLDIERDFKDAFKRSDKVRVSVLRMAKAAMKNRQIEKGEELSDEDVLSVLSTMAKQRRESIEQFSRGGREELASKEKEELVIILSYMPAQMGPDEIDQIIREAISETSAQGLQDLGKVMRIVMPRTKGAADGKAVNQRVRELLDQSS
jgi:uncharacterized protein YqeY